MLKKIVYSLGALAMLAMAVGAGFKPNVTNPSAASRPSGPPVPPGGPEGLAAFTPGIPAPDRPNDLPPFGYRPTGLPTPRPMQGRRYEPRHSLNTKQERETQGGVRMRAKLSGWKHLLYTAAALATLALAAGARYKPR